MHDDAEQPEALIRARADIDGGRAWNAANRLQSFLSTEPLHHEARLMLGQLLLDSGAPADAGAVLMPSERNDEAARSAIDAWLELVATDPDGSLRLIRGQGFGDPATVAQLGPIGRARMEPLSARIREELDDEADDEERSDGSGGPVAVGCTLGCGALIAVLGAGVFQIAKWLGL